MPGAAICVVHSIIAQFLRMLWDIEKKVVRMAGLEPARPKGQQILSL